jgi:putative membrane fusion protein
MKKKSTKEQNADGQKSKMIEFPSKTGNKDDPGPSQVFNRRRATLGGILLLLFALLYIPSLLNWLTGSHVATDIVRNGLIEEYIRLSVVIVRDEELLEPSAIEGQYIPEVNEGEKTAAFSTVAMIVNDASKGLLQDMETINAKIVKARMEKAEKTDFFSEDLSKLDTEIELRVRDLITACNASDFEGMGRCRAEIGKIVEKKAEIIGDNYTDSYISSLIKQKEAIRKKINSSTINIKSSISGIVSYVIDGFETKLTPADLDALTPEKLDEIKMLDSRKKTVTGRVQAGVPVVKIIKGPDIYIVAAIPAKNAPDFKTGKRIKLRINETGMETSGDIVNMKDTGKDRIVMAVRISRGADTLSAYRVVNVDFISKTEEGLKVPVKCLRDISSDGRTARIMLVKYNTAVNRIVDIVLRDKEFAIIKPHEAVPGESETGGNNTGGIDSDNTVNLYDTYIINPDNIEEGDIIDR